MSENRKHTLGHLDTLFHKAEELEKNMTKIHTEEENVMCKESSLNSIEIEKMLTVSSAHVTQDTFNRLMNDPDCNEIGLPVYEKVGPNGGLSFGMYVYIKSYEKICVDIPDDLMVLIKIAQDNGCSVLCLDADGQELDGCTLYEWED